MRGDEGVHREDKGATKLPDHHMKPMLIALAVFAVIALVGIGYVTWGAILVGREYNAQQRVNAAPVAQPQADLPASGLERRTGRNEPLTHRSWRGFVSGRG